MLKQTIGFLILVSLGFVSVPSNADEQLTSSNNSWLSNGKELGEWWHKSPRKYDPLPKPWLYHFELGYSYSEMGGNIDNKVHTGKMDLTLRKHLFTSRTHYDISKSDMDINLTGTNTQMDTRSFREQFVWSVTDRIAVIAGFTWQKDMAKFIDDRSIYYVGGGVILVDSPVLDLNVTGSFGHVETAYMNEYLAKKPIFGDLPFSSFVEDYESEAIYLTQKLNWKINDKLSISQSQNYLVSLDDSEFYNWKGTLALNVKLTDIMSFVTSYTINYDNNSFIEAAQDYLEKRKALGKRSGEMETTDTMLTVGIKLSF